MVRDRGLRVRRDVALVLLEQLRQRDQPGALLFVLTDDALDLGKQPRVEGVERVPRSLRVRGPTGGAVPGGGAGDRGGVDARGVDLGAHRWSALWCEESEEARDMDRLPFEM